MADYGELGKTSQILAKIIETVLTVTIGYAWGSLGDSCSG